MNAVLGQPAIAYRDETHSRFGNHMRSDNSQFAEGVSQMTDGDVIKGKKVRIDRVYPDTLQSHFVSTVVVQHQPDAFILSFFEVWPPAVLGETAEEKQRALESIENVEAKCVARLVLTPGKMREVVGIMTENLKSYDLMLEMQPKLSEGE